MQIDGNKFIETLQSQRNAALDELARAQTVIAQMLEDKRKEEAPKEDAPDE